MGRGWSLTRLPTHTAHNATTSQIAANLLLRAVGEKMKTKGSYGILLLLNLAYFASATKYDGQFPLLWNAIEENSTLNFTCCGDGTRHVGVNVNASTLEVEYGPWNGSCDGVKFPLQGDYCNLQVECVSRNDTRRVIVREIMGMECPSHRQGKNTFDLFAGKVFE